MLLNDRIQVTAVCRVGEQIGLNVRQFRVKTQVGDGASETEAALYFATQLSPPYRAWLASSAEFRGVVVFNYFPLGLITAVSAGGAGVGSNLILTAPRQCSGLVKINTALAGRKFRGRMYVPFVADQNVELTDKLTAAGKAQLNTVAAAWLLEHTINGINGSVTLFPIIQHRKPDTGFQDVTGFTVRDGLATQRRRGFYGRPNPIPPI